LYGGEACAYTEKNQQKTIADVYYQVEKVVQLQHKAVETELKMENSNKEKQTEPELVPFHSICTSCKNGGMCGCTVANTMVKKTQ
jgi:hypothetical protein